MPNVLVVGATRGLGAALVSYYSQQPSTTVYATSRSSSTRSDSSKPNNVHWVTKIDLMSPSCGTKLASSLKSTRIDTLYITAGYFATEDFSKGPDWDAEIQRRLNNTDIVVLLISENFLKAKFCLFEAERAMQLREARKCVIIPVLLSYIGPGA